jgi:hypothetical protein
MKISQSMVGWLAILHIYALLSTSQQHIHSSTWLSVFLEFYDVMKKEVKQSEEFDSKQNAEGVESMSKAQKLVDLLCRCSDFETWAVSMKALALVRKYMNDVD